jgi:membrane-associated phospholipid phosphatase
MFQRTQSANFRNALLVTLLLFLITGLFLWRYGKNGSFLIINSHHTPALDVLFQYATYLGHVLIYIPLLLYCIFFNRGFILSAMLSIIICLLLTHVLKQHVFPDLLRPISLEAQNIVVHKIEGIHINHFNSFPSGHTATAFATALLLTSIFRNKLWGWLLPLLPFFVAYSRVYLAQHFVSDVLGGMALGIITVLVSFWIQPVITKALPQAWQEHMKKPVVP